MASPDIAAIGIPWYTRETYAEIRRLMVDSRLLPPTFEQWLRSAEATRDQLRAKGGVAFEIHLDPREFTDWCRQRGLQLDAQARMRFAAEAARHRLRN